MLLQLGSIPALLLPPSFERVAAESFNSSKLFQLSAGSAVTSDKERGITALWILCELAWNQGREGEGAADSSGVSCSSQFYQSHSLALSA